MPISRLKHLAGLVRRYDGTLLPILKTESVDGRVKLHIQGSVVDFWATPEELYMRGYRLLCAKPAIWNLWSPVMCQAQAHPQRMSVPLQ